MSGRSPARREPLAVALLLINLGLAGVLTYRNINRRGHGALPAGHPDVHVPADLAQPKQAALRTDPFFSLTGVVKISPGLKEPWPKEATVFVIARSAEGGAPYAVHAYKGVKPPFTFSLTEEDVMMRWSALPQRFRMSVRVDQDGDAATRQLGDLEGGPSSIVMRSGSVDVIVDRPARLVPEL